MKQTIKKMVALGVGLTMVGATIFGASAVNLASWPAPFVVNGVPAANYAILVGDNAAGSDVVGAIDINGALQQAAVVKTTVTAPAVSGVIMTGDAAEFGSTSDLLEIGEVLGDVRETFTEVDLDMLKGGQIVTDEGSTEYNQYLRFNQAGVWPANPFGGIMPSASVLFAEDERDKVGHYLYWNDGVQLFEWELEFEEGLESEVTGTGNTQDLADLEDEDVFILGQPFVIVDTDLAANTMGPKGGIIQIPYLTIELMGGATGGILGENDKETYVIDGKEYEVEVVVISETSANGEGSVKFRINGEITDELTDGETDVLADGTQIGIRDILATGKDIQKSIVQFYIGAYKVEFEDNNTADTKFQSSGTEVNEETIEDSKIRIRGNFVGTGQREFEITNIQYRLFADSVLGDTYISPGTGLREQLDEPEGMLTPFWDVRYEGLMDTGVTIVRVDAAGDDEYNLEFTNQEGIMYDMPLLSNENQNINAAGAKAGNDVVWGDDDDDLWFMESNNWVIGDDDYFILSNCQAMPYNWATGNDNTCFTHVLRYDSLDNANRQLTFTDLGTGTREVTYDANTCIANIVVGGVTYTIEVNDFTTCGAVVMPSGAVVGTPAAIPRGNLNIDLAGDGLVCDSTVAVAGCAAAGHLATGDQVLIGLQGEGLIHFTDGECLAQTAATSLRAAPTLKANSNACTPLKVGYPARIDLALITLGKEFDEAVADEIINVTFEGRPSQEMGLRGVQGAPLFYGLFDLEENEDLEQALSGYGVFLELYDPSGSQEAEDLTVEYPLSQRGARVFVTGGQVSVQEIGTGGVTERLQPIQLGSAKLASEISDITQFNAIVVGGPCANPLAAQLMGSPEPCWESIPENKAIVKLYTHANGNVALLVAGRTAMNTRQACRAVATGKTAVAGTEAEISGTSLTDISVRAV